MSSLLSWILSIATFCRHHPADVNTVPWDWDLLTSVMTDKVQTRKILHLLTYLFYKIFKVAFASENRDCIVAEVSLLQEQPNKRKCEVVRVLLEYVVRTLEDDFHAKRAISAFSYSISGAMLSCNQQFHHVR